MKILFYSAVIVVTLCIATIYNVLHSDIQHISKHTDENVIQEVAVPQVAQETHEITTPKESIADTADTDTNSDSDTDSDTDTNANVSEIPATTSETSIPEPSITHRVPFVSQAPTAQWDLPIHQDGCEEATITMALGWAEKTPSISKEEAVQSIQDITDFTTKKFGHFTSDTSAYDTAQIINEYTPILQARIHENVSLEEMKHMLRENVVIVAPLNGQLLQNPHFTGKGPLHHMLLIIGYDNKTKEFIVNDPGTRVGASYRYPEDILYSALRDYATGNHEVDGVVHKNIIVIRKTEEKTKEIEGAIQ